MKKRITRLIALLLCIMSVVTIFVMPVSAASVPSYNCQYSSKSGGGSMYFYVKTGSSSSSRKIDLTMGTGTLYAVNWNTGKVGSASVYGAYEIKVFYKNSSGNWVLEQDYDVYNKSSDTITCKKTNTVYKIQVYFWRVGTTFNSYWNKNVTTKTLSKKMQARFAGSSASEWNEISWSTLPKCTAKPKSGYKLYDVCP